MIYFRSSIKEDIPRIIEDIRASDVEECEIMETTPQDSLELGFKSKNCYTGIVNGKPEFMFGSVHYSNELGIAWLLGTNKIEEHKDEFIKNTPLIFSLLEGSFISLTNFIPSSNEKSAKWLEKSGCTIDQEVEMNGVMMKQFTYKCSTSDAKSNRYAGSYKTSKESY